MTTTPIAPLATVLVVDDAPANLSLLAGLLNRLYRVKLAASGAKALEIARRDRPDLILLDVMMPEMDGYEVCRRLKADPATAGIPVLFLTAMSQVEDETRGFEVGAADFIHKPVSPPIVQARVRTHLQIKTYQDELIDRAEWLERELAKRLTQVDQLREATLHVMISFAEFRDEDTGHHVKRTQEYVRTLAQHLYEQGRHLDVLNPESIDHIARSAPLHDVGKVAIPDHILLKPGRHTPEETVIMRTHAMHGWEMLRRAAERLGEHADFLTYAMQIARAHHERWDGTGYPDGLQGEAIPLAARLMSVADVYDALISRRPYKIPFAHEEAVRLIDEGSGHHFDPEVVAAFHATIDQFRSIADTWRDA
ncbi:two-component system response regulator [Aquabacterium olei]|uniref:Two-component system response regulator n=1 Tax=Aquabacterium olei TaxID=1296669 RepID=A0A2U8FV34_9BURK|nr:two-component system response regulator [Aquabacterium olei]AWI54931.1 two-component system response regulator [Aquabacterium olei]